MKQNAIQLYPNRLNRTELNSLGLNSIDLELKTTGLYLNSDLRNSVHLNLTQLNSS